MNQMFAGDYRAMKKMIVFKKRKEVERKLGVRVATGRS